MLRGMDINFGGFIGDKVAAYLQKIWKDEDYQRRIDEFGMMFRRLGRNFVIFVAEDPFIPNGSSVVSGADVIVLPKSKSLLSFWDAHGRALKDTSSRELTTKITGRNLAAVY